MLIDLKFSPSHSEKYAKPGYLLKDKIQSMVENDTFSNISDYFYLEKDNYDFASEFPWNVF